MKYLDIIFIWIISIASIINLQTCYWESGCLLRTLYIGIFFMAATFIVIILNIIRKDFKKLIFIFPQIIYSILLFFGLLGIYL